MTAKVQRESRNFSDWGLLRGSTRMDTGLLLPFGTVAKPGKTTDFGTAHGPSRLHVESAIYRHSPKWDFGTPDY
jgi:hypothetical protein